MRRRRSPQPCPKLHPPTSSSREPNPGALSVTVVEVAGSAGHNLCKPSYTTPQPCATIMPLRPGNRASGRRRSNRRRLRRSATAMPHGLHLETPRQFWQDGEAVKRWLGEPLVRIPGVAWHRCLRGLGCPGFISFPPG
jgi:hypothetical protein